MSEPKTKPAEPPPDENLFAEGIKHAESGYKNAQDVIRFIDSKAGVIAGFTSVGLGVMMQGIKEFLCLNKDIQDSIVAILKLHPVCAVVLFTFCVLSIGLGIVCLICVVQCVTARAARMNSKLKHTMLFPFYDATKDLDSARLHFEKLERGLTHKEIADEYGVQLLNVGAILHQKMKFQRWATNAFLAQLVLISVSGALLFGFSYKFIIAPKMAHMTIPVATAPTTPAPPVGQ